MEIFGIELKLIEKSDSAQKIEELFSHAGVHHIITLNPEILLRGESDETYKKILANADFHTVDGVGLQFALKMRGESAYRFTGVDLLQTLLYTANAKKESVYALIPGNALSQKVDIEGYIRENYPDCDLEVVVGDSYEDIATAAAFSGLIISSHGAPRQEEILAEIGKRSSLHGKIEKSMILVGVGGAFDFLTGKVGRAPAWMQKFGLEWLYRLAKEPKRLKRIINACMVFPYKVITYKK